jgi:Flp pilus assembly protein TadG
MEFALVVPVFISLLFAVIQSGITFFAFTGLQNTVAEAAREATLFPIRSDNDLRARIEARRFGLDPSKLAVPLIVRGTQDGQNFVQITLTYQAEFNFVMFTVPSIVLSQTRRAYLPAAPEL